MSRKLRIVGWLAGGVAVIGVAVFGLSRSGYGIELNDEGTGLRIYTHHEVKSEIKEGYLVLQAKRTLTSPNLRQSTFYQYDLYESPSIHSGYFEVWSDQLQPSQSHGKTTFKGPKIRLELESRKIDILKADVWYIKRPL